MKIMIALDDSLYSGQIVKDILGRSWPENCEFKLITVLEPLRLSDEDMHKQVVSEVQEMRKEAARQFLTEVKEQFDKFPGSTVHFEIREGIPEQEILDSAVEWEPDRLLIGALGRGAGESKRAAKIGSTSSTVASHAPCSVEVLRQLVPAR